MERLLLGIKALEFLKEEGFPVLESKLAKSSSEAIRLAKAIGFPVVLKISSDSVIHKTELGLVKTSIFDEEGIRKGYKEIMDSFLDSCGGGNIDGVIVQKQGKGLEFFVGVYYDSHFGPVIGFGQGGIYVEEIKDITFRLLPITRQDVKSMVEDLKVSALFFSKRKRFCGLDAIEDLLLKISDTLIKRPYVKEMDLNPIFVGEDIGISDVRIRLGI